MEHTEGIKTGWPLNGYIPTDEQLDDPINEHLMPFWNVAEITTTITADDLVSSDDKRYIGGMDDVERVLSRAIGRQLEYDDPLVEANCFMINIYADGWEEPVKCMYFDNATRLLLECIYLDDVSVYRLNGHRITLTAENQYELDIPPVPVVNTQH